SRSGAGEGEVRLAEAPMPQDDFVVWCNLRRNNACELLWRTGTGSTEKRIYIFGGHCTEHVRLTLRRPNRRLTVPNNDSATVHGCLRIEQRCRRCTRTGRTVASIRVKRLHDCLTSRH